MWLILVLVAVLMGGRVDGVDATTDRGAGIRAVAYRDSEGDSRADADSFTVVGSLRTTATSPVTSVLFVALGAEGPELPCESRG